jgi:hypothetical protein
MRGVAVVSGLGEAGECERRRATDVRVGKEYETALGKVERVLDLKLEVGQELDLIRRNRGRVVRLERLQEHRRQRIIASARVAITEDQKRGWGGSSDHRHLGEVRSTAAVERVGE